MKKILQQSILNNIYRGNKIIIYSLKLRELLTHIITCYTYFLLSVSRQGAKLHSK